MGRVVWILWNIPVNPQKPYSIQNSGMIISIVFSTFLCVFEVKLIYLLFWHNWILLKRSTLNSSFTDNFSLQQIQFFDALMPPIDASAIFCLMHHLWQKLSVLCLFRIGFIIASYIHRREVFSLVFSSENSLQPYTIC